jgi:YesN/AraC family two-component response regulator
MAPRILLVDDEPDFLDVFGEFLEEQAYEVLPALNAAEALAILEREPVDLLLSDINMPGMKGFELLHEASTRYPTLRTALITAYDVRDYLHMARTHNIGNIITKTTPFNFDEIRIVLSNILTGDIFGLQRYVKAPILSREIRHTDEIETVINEIIDAIADERMKRKFRQAAGEIVINAFFYGGRNERGDRKEAWDLDSSLEQEKSITVSWGIDTEKIGVAVRDQSGRLMKNEVLYWLERNSTKGPNGISIGLMDEHGKGLFIAHETIDRFIVNIERGKTTEVILINYLQGIYNGHRPLWIQEL